MKPRLSEKDFDYLLNGANEILDKVYKQRPLAALEACQALVDRLRHDLKPDGALYRVLKDAERELAVAGREAIMKALDSFSRLEKEAFIKAKASPHVIEAVMSGANMAFLHASAFQLDLESLRKQLDQLSEDLRYVAKNQKDNKLVDKYVKKAGEAAGGGAAIYVDATIDLVLTFGALSSLSIWFGGAVMSHALGVKIPFLGKDKADG